MHSKRDNIEIITNDEGRKDIKKIFKSLKKIYQIKLECMKGSELVFSYVHFLYYKCHQVNLTISLNVLYAKTYPNYVSKHNSNHEKTSYYFNDCKWKRKVLSCMKNYFHHWNSV